MRTRSLTVRLSVLVALTIVVVGGIAGTWAYLQALQAARNLQDDVLAQVASIASATTAKQAATADDIPISDTASDIDVTSLRKSGLPPSTPGGFGTAQIGGEPRRYFVIRNVTGTELVVSQSVEVRDDTARATAVATVAPLLILVPVLILAIYVVVRGVMRPVNELARHVHARTPTDLSPLDVEQAPDELRDFLTALNTQFQRVRDTLGRERLFIAKAAHELRTPLTAMSLQLERAIIAPDSTKLRSRLEELSSGVERSRHLVNQMLDLAQAQAGSSQPQPAEPLGHIIRQIVGDLLPLADTAGVDLDVDLGDTGHQPVPAAPVTSIVRNLIDNAVRYTGRDGHVHISASASATELVISVDDDGPGITSPDTVLLPFHREAGQDNPGSGLGLAVVAEQLQHLGGHLTLQPTTRYAHGTQATITLLEPPGPVLADAPAADKRGPEGLAE